MDWIQKSQGTDALTKERVRKVQPQAVYGFAPSAHESPYQASTILLNSSVDGGRWTLNANGMVLPVFEVTLVIYR